jgi:hypothetical protein
METLISVALVLIFFLLVPVFQLFFSTILCGQFISYFYFEYAYNILNNMS